MAAQALGFIDLEGEEDFTSCCDEHDACYQVCGMTKKRCDMKFWECLEHMCETVFTSNKQCRSAANIYYIATRTLGREFYEDAQSEHCMCLESEKVSDHYRISSVPFMVYTHLRASQNSIGPSTKTLLGPSWLPSSTLSMKSTSKRLSTKVLGSTRSLRDQLLVRLRRLMRGETSPHMVCNLRKYKKRVVGEIMMEKTQCLIRPHAPFYANSLQRKKSCNIREYRGGEV